MRRLAVAAFGWLPMALALLIGSSAGAGQEFTNLRPDRHYVPLGQVYPGPPPGFLRLPSSESPGPAVRDQGPGRPGPVWTPARTEIVVGIDGSGRIRHVQEYVPGHFAGR